MKAQLLKSLSKNITHCALALSLCSCASSNTSNVSSQPFFGQPELRGTYFNHESSADSTFAITKDCKDRNHFGKPINYLPNAPVSLNNSVVEIPSTRQPSVQHTIPLSPGDMVELTIENGEGFNGRYVIDNGGFIHIPLLSPIAVSGMPVNLVVNKIEMALIKASIFQPQTALVSLQVLNWSAIEVAVSGAVFQPGRVLINNKHPNSQMDERVAASGDFSVKRLLSEALRAASGIRPDAKLEQVILIRKGWQVQVDLTGIITGHPVVDYPLVAGDQIIVPSTGCFQSGLVRPSQITPKGFRMFMSNLTDSAMSNASAAVGRYATNMPYGTRLLQGAISANCVGGKAWTNADRKVVLASRHPITHETQVIERSVESLMQNAQHNAVNPYLMPNDAIACYDSNVTNLRDVAKTVVDIISPFVLF